MKMSHFVSTVLYVIAITVLVVNGDDSGSCGANLKWYYFYDTKTLLINGTGEMSNFSISAPWQYNYVFNNTIVEEGVTSIGENAFYRISTLVSITIPSSVTSIRRQAFYSCSRLKNVVIPPKVTTIQPNTFYKCSSLTNVTIPSTVTSISSGAFAWCTSLTSIHIPETVTKIDGGAFKYCSNLLSIHVDPQNRYYMSDDDGVLFNKQKTTLVQYPAGRKGNYSIPEGVTLVEYNAFSGCTDLSYVELPSTMTSVSYGAFADCFSLKEVNIPSTITTFDSACFYGCKNLMSLAIPSQITSIGDSAFYDCKSLTEVTFESDNLTIGRLAFYGSGLMKLIIPTSVVSIDSRAFSSCDSLTTVTYLGYRDICLDSNVFEYCDMLDFICLPRDYWGSNFGGFSSIQKSDTCDELTSLSNQCYGVVFFDNTYTIYERSAATKWQNKTNKCVEYVCGNETGLFHQGLCLSSDDNEMMCINDTCQNVNEYNPNRYAVKVILNQPFDPSSTLLQEDKIKSLEIFRYKKYLNVGLQVNDEGQVINILIFSPSRAYQDFFEEFASKINEIEKDPVCSEYEHGIFCYSENATVFYSEYVKPSPEPSGATSSHNKMACIIAALFAVVVSLMTLVL